MFKVLSPYKSHLPAPCYAAKLLLFVNAGFSSCQQRLFVMVSVCMTNRPHDITGLLPETFKKTLMHLKVGFMDFSEPQVFRWILSVTYRTKGLSCHKPRCYCSLRRLNRTCGISGLSPVTINQVVTSAAWMWACRVLWSAPRWPSS